MASKIKIATPALEPNTEKAIHTYKTVAKKRDFLAGACIYCIYMSTWGFVLGPSTTAPCRLCITNIV